MNPAPPRAGRCPSWDLHKQARVLFPLCGATGISGLQGQGIQWAAKFRPRGLTLVSRLGAGIICEVEVVSLAVPLSSLIF